MNYSIPRFILCISCLLITFFSQAQNKPVGLGIAKPEMKPGAKLYLYTGQLIDDLLHHAATKDSIVILQGEHSFEIGTAPAWFSPEHLKMDYEILQLRVVSVSRNWLEVIVNTKTGRTAWVDKNVVEFLYWPDFFLTVFSVEVMNAAKNPARIKPLDNAAVVLNPGRSSLHPIAIQGEWMKVSTVQENPDAVPKLGWIRWKKGNQMLITWSLLS